MNYYYYLHYFN